MACMVLQLAILITTNKLTNYTDKCITNFDKTDLKAKFTMVSIEDKCGLLPSIFVLVTETEITINGADGKYTGEVNVNNLPHGNGFLKRDDNGFDEGMFSEGKIKGYCKATHPEHG